MSNPRKPKFKAEIWIPLFVAVITVIGSIIVTFLNNQNAREKARLEILPTINALETRTSSQAILPALTQTISLKDEHMVPIQAFPLRIFPYAGGNTPLVIGYGAMSLNYGAQGEISYTLDYDLPPLEQGITWAGISMQFAEPTDLSGFTSLKIAIKYSDVDAHCEVKFADKSDHTATFLLGDISRSNTGVVVQVDGDKQVITIPLHINFDVINLEQGKELGFAVNSNLGTGKHYFIISDIQFLK